MNFNYSASEAYAKKLGLFWRPDWLTDFDQQAAASCFSQAQVDIAIQHHLFAVRNRLFNPSTYTIGQRLLLAAHFIFGKGIKNVG